MMDGTELEALRPLLGSVEEADVVVVGGGTAGFTAAYAAAGTGMETVIVESGSFLGGTGYNSGNTYPANYDVLGTRWSLTGTLRF